MKKLSFFAVAIAALAFTACGGNKKTAEETETVKSFEQEQVEEKIKVELDSLAAEFGKLDKLPFVQEGEKGVQLTAEEKQVKPDYLLAPSVIDNAATLTEKYRLLGALSVDKLIAGLYDMPLDDYQAAITKLATDIDDPSFKDIEDVSTVFEAGEKIYEGMNQNGRINYFWQMAAASLIEEINVLCQNTEKFTSVLDDNSASNITYRLILLSDAVTRLAGYDSEFEPVAKALDSLNALNATTVDELKKQLTESKDKIAEARNALIK